MKPATLDKDAHLRQAAASAIPRSSVDTDHWWRYKNLRTLNLLLFFPMLSIFTLGFDGSMMNGFVHFVMKKGPGRPY